MQPTTALPSGFSNAPEPTEPRAVVHQQPRARRFRTFRVISALIMRETGSRESRTSLGFLWTMIDPILGVMILSICFLIIQRQPRYGTNFPLFYVTGVLPFHLYTHVAGRVATSIRYSSNLLGFPSVTVIDVIMARFILNVFTNLVVFLAMAIWVVEWYDLRVNPNLYEVILSLTMAAALGLGIGTMNSFLFLWQPAYETLWSVLNRPMTIFSGVMFSISDLPTYIFNILKWLPMAHLVAEMRHAYYPSYMHDFVSPAYVFLISAVAFTIGLVGLHRYVFDLLEKR